MTDMRTFIHAVEPLIMETMEADLANTELPNAVKRAALHLYQKVAHNTLLCGDVAVVDGYWIETHTLGCRNAADDPEDQWQSSHEEIWDEYKDNGKTVVLGEPWDGGVFITITPQTDHAQTAPVQLLETTQTVRLNDLYTSAELHDETERLGMVGIEMGGRWWQRACAYPLPIKAIAAEQAATSWTTGGRPLLRAFRNATKGQRQIVAGKQRDVSDRIVIVDGTAILDGNHQAVACIRNGTPIRYIDLADLPEDF
jgi:hypothetical protein